MNKIAYTLNEWIVTAAGHAQIQDYLPWTMTLCTDSHQEQPLAATAVNIPKPQHFRKSSADEAVDDNEEPLALTGPFKGLVLGEVEDKKARPHDHRTHQPHKPCNTQG